MINIFNRKKLYEDTSAEDAARVWSILRKNGIKYTMNTKGVMPSALRAHYTKMETGVFGGNMRYSDSSMSGRQLLYVIHVHRRDYERAKELIN